MKTEAKNIVQCEQTPLKPALVTLEKKHLVVTIIGSCLSSFRSRASKME